MRRKMYDSREHMSHKGKEAETHIKDWSIDRVSAVNQKESGSMNYKNRKDMVVTEDEKKLSRMMKMKY